MREKLMFQNAPHVRQSESVLTIMTDVVIALVPLYIMSFFYYGVRALVLGLCGVASCLVFSAVGSLVSKERPNIRDLTSAITGLIIPLLMPAERAITCLTPQRWALPPWRCAGPSLCIGIRRCSAP